MITVAGEALFDVFPRPVGADPTQRVLDAVTGGSPFNVACGLGRLGHAPAFFGGLTDGPLGDQQAQILAQAGVRADAVMRKPNLAPLMLITLAEDGQPAYNYYGQSTADVAVEESDLDVLPQMPEILHLGSYSLVVEPIAETLAKLVQRLPDASLLALDPNARPMIQPDPAVWQRRLAPLYDRANIIKVSDEDIAFLAPDQTPQAYAGALHDASGAPVFLTMGEGGVTLFASGSTAHVAAPKVSVVDTVGAGDSFQTTLLAWASRPQNKQALSARSVSLDAAVDVAEVAVAVAALICSQKGPVMPEAQALEQAISTGLFQRIALHT
jgi:fructokinase